MNIKVLVASIQSQFKDCTRLLQSKNPEDKRLGKLRQEKLRHHLLKFYSLFEVTFVRVEVQVTLSDTKYYYTFHFQTKMFQSFSEKDTKDYILFYLQTKEGLVLIREDIKILESSEITFKPSRM